MKCNLVILGMALTATAASIPQARDTDVPAQCQWNGYTQKNFKGEPITSRSTVTVCNEIRDIQLINDLKSAKVTLGNDVCLYVSPVGCEGEGLEITTKGNPNIPSNPKFHHWKCGPCFADS